MSTSSTPEVRDVAIVGGGVSGVYTGFRLLGADLSKSALLRGWAGAASSGGAAGKLSVSVFETSDRIGGRLLSARAPGAPHVVCELGGMRYMSSQTLVKCLVENELRLPTKPQVVDKPENLAYLRGRRLRQGQLTKEPDVIPYDLAWNERGQDPSGLMGTALAQVIPGVDKLSGPALRKMLDAFRLDDKPLREHGFWNVVARAMSHEAYALSTATVGYDSLGANGNAVDQTFEYFDFTPTTKYSLFVDGYETVPWKLRDGFVAAGGKVEMGATLRAFDAAKMPDGSQGVLLQFRDRPPLLARALVLAMPQRSLRMLDVVGPVLTDPVVQELIGSVFPVPLFKMFLAYPFPWWESVGVKEGRSLTDTMVRQCYYWAVEGQQPGADPKNTNALLMAYDDLSNVLFWGGLRGFTSYARRVGASLGAGAGAGGPMRALKMFADRLAPNASPGDDNWRINRAPETMVAEMHREIVEMHGVKYAPEPYAAAYHDWSDDPYGGGVHFWNVGYDSTAVMDRMTQPRPDFPCYVCGEAYSQGQTWAEGALQTAEIVLQQRFGLAPPPWVK
ncbi:MAG TPA: FAD-dependent oxidoreductase [Polyangiaceae bacterium]|jgi:monoamine oxidase